MDDILKQKYRILYLQTDFPYPPTGGGRARAFNLLREIAKRHSVTLVSFASAACTSDDVQKVKSFCTEVVTIPFMPKQSLLWLLRSQFSRIPYKVLQYYCPGFSTAVRKLTSIHKYDLIFSEHPYLAQYIPVDARCVIAQNIEMMANIYRRTAESGNLMMRLYASTQWEKMMNYELALYKRYGVFIALNAEERERIASLLPDTKICYVPNGVNIDYFSRGVDTPNRHSMNIVFSGVFSYYPNEQAVIYFAKEILPIIQKQVIDLHFFIVGKEPGKKVRELNAKGSITVTGFVDDVRPFFQNSAVVVAPLLIGGGTRLKILEAMAMGKSVVSTSIGCEGLEVENGKNILVADSPADFAACVVRLLKDEEYAKTLGDNAMKLIESKYRWETIGERLSDFIEDFVQSSRGRQVEGIPH